MAFRFDKLTIKAQEAMASAQSLASDGGHPEIDPLHLLAALLAEQEGAISPIIDRIGANRPQLEQIVQSELGHFPTVSGQLREDVADAQLGTPMDLNGDGAIDGADHSGDYVLLPVRIRVRWRGVTGLRTFDVCTVLLRE